MAIQIKSGTAAPKKKVPKPKALFVVILFAVAALYRTNHKLKSYDSVLKTATIKTAPTTTRRLPILEELTSIPATYDCPEGYEEFENIVLPQSVTHANRKIPKVVHITSKTRCVSETVKNNVLRWKFPNHSLYIHDDAAIYKLLDYAINDRFGNELVQNLSKSVLCMSSGATLSDIWRYTALYHYGGIYTDIDNLPGKDYHHELIQPDTDSFFVMESLGIMSQFYMASSKHHPIMLQFLRKATNILYNKDNNVMVNYPPIATGPGAVKRGFIKFLRATNSTTTSDGYEPAGIYDGGLGVEFESELPWYKIMVDEEYPPRPQFTNRTVTIIGNKAYWQQYILRSGLSRRDKREYWTKMNMTDYRKDPLRFTPKNRISCVQHASRMARLTSTNTSFYYMKSSIADLVPRYAVQPRTGYYYDRNTNQSVLPNPYKNPANYVLDGLDAACVNMICDSLFWPGVEFETASQCRKYILGNPDCSDLFMTHNAKNGGCGCYPAGMTECVNPIPANGRRVYFLTSIETDSRHLGPAPGGCVVPFPGITCGPTPMGYTTLPGKTSDTECFSFSGSYTCNSKCFV